MAIKIVPLLLAAVALAIGSAAVSEHPPKHYAEYPPKAYDYKSIFSLIVRGKCGVIPGTTTAADMVVEDEMVRHLTSTASLDSISEERLGGEVGSFGAFIDECQYHDGVAIEGFETLPETVDPNANITAPSSVWYCCPGKLLADFDTIAKGCSYSLAGDTMAPDGSCGAMLSAGLSVVTHYGKMQTICCGPKDNFLDTGYL